VARRAALLGARRSQHQARNHLSQAHRAEGGDGVTEYEATSAAGDAEHVPASVTQKSLNIDIMKMLERPGLVWWGVFILDLIILSIGALAERNQIVLGIGVAGHTRPVMWASYVTNFVFWVGIAHCGTLVSAILFLFRSHFRRAVYRVSEAMTVFGV